MPGIYDFQDDVKTKVRNKLARDAQEARKDKAAYQKKKHEEKLEKQKLKVEFRQYRNEYKVFRDDLATKLATALLEVWKAEIISRNQAEKKIPSLTKEQWSDFNSEIERQYLIARNTVYSANTQRILEYTYNFTEGEKYESFAKKHGTTYEAEIKYIETTAQRLENRAISKLKKASKLFFEKFKTDTQSSLDSNKVTQKLAELPYKIEEKVDEFKDIIDKLLGKTLGELGNPQSINFDINYLIGKIETALNPVVSSVSPLQAVASFPVVGDLVGLLTQVSGASSPSTMTEEDLKKYIQQHGLPSIDTSYLDKIGAIKDDMMILMQTLSMSMINVILAMVDVIYSKLKIVTSVVPLGGMFPLSLIPNAIDAGKLLWQLTYTLPPLVYNMIKGAIKKKMAEAMALQFPEINLIPDNQLMVAISETQARKAKDNIATKPMTYDDVCDDVYTSELFPMGYPKSVAKKILTEYKKINNKTNIPMKQFKDDGEQSLKPVEGTIASVTSTALQATGLSDSSGSSEKLGYKESTTVRGTPSPQGFQEYIKGIIEGAQELSASLSYDRVISTKDLAGQYYSDCKKKINDWHGEVTVETKVEPSSAIKSLYERTNEINIQKLQATLTKLVELDGSDDVQVEVDI